MKRTRFLAMLLACAMLLGLGVAASAEGTDDAALKAVTLKVKNTLGLDTDVYTDFDGTSSEQTLLGRRWSLTWSGDGVSLFITCDDNGKIYSYDKSDAVSDEPVAVWTTNGRFNIPPLPTGSADRAHEAAQAFLGKVLTAGVETVELENDWYPSLRATSFRYGGTVLLNGLESPINCSVTVRASDNEVLRFWRSDTYTGYAGALPSTDTTVTEAQARRSLRNTATMEPYYVLGDDGVTATVQYLPVWGDDYYVDGKTGDLVNLTELRANLWETTNKFAVSDSVAEAPEASLAGGAQLTQAELDGAAKLAGAMDKEALDQAVKNAWPEFGLKGYTLASASYSTIELPRTDEEIAAGKAPEYDVTCRLTYGLKLGESTARKVVEVNAKNGDVLSLSGYRPWEDGTNLKIYRVTALETAQAVLESFVGSDIYNKLALFETQEAQKDGSTQHIFTFAHKENGYFYRDNSYVVAVDAVDGSVSRLSGGFDEKVVLVNPGSVVNKDEALTAYMDALDLKYSYLDVPVSINLAGPEIYEALKDSLYTYVQTLKPGFTMVQPEDRYVRAVDAKTGEVIQDENVPEEPNTLTYDDIEGTWVQEGAEALAVYQVGFPGGSLKSGETLTQLDMLVLLASVDGYQFDPAASSQDELDWFYDHCYYLGLVTPETRDEDKPVTRGELVRLILDAAGLERVAAMTGIFRCAFSDEASIPAADYGYAALAQGLGLVRGGSDGAYAAGRVATRGEAVAMLYQYMK